MSYAHILGTMYEHSSYYDKGFIIDELMLYHIIYDLYHDPYLVPRRDLVEEGTVTGVSILQLAGGEVMEEGEMVTLKGMMMTLLEAKY